MELKQKAFQFLVGLEALTLSDLREVRRKDRIVLAEQAAQGVERGTILAIALSRYARRSPELFSSDEARTLVSNLQNSIKDSSTPSSKLYNWNLLIQALGHVGFEIDSDNKALVVAGDTDIIVDVLEEVCTLLRAKERENRGYESSRAGTPPQQLSARSQQQQQQPPIQQGFSPMNSIIPMMIPGQNGQAQQAALVVFPQNGSGMAQSFSIIASPSHSGANPQMMTFSAQPSVSLSSQHMDPHQQQQQPQLPPSSYGAPVPAPESQQPIIEEKYRPTVADLQHNLDIEDNNSDFALSPPPDSPEPASEEPIVAVVPSLPPMTAAMKEQPAAALASPHPRDISEARTCFDFFVLSLCAHLKISMQRAVAFLTTERNALSDLIRTGRVPDVSAPSAGGIQWDPILKWSQELLSNTKLIQELITTEPTSLGFSLDLIALGLRSDNLEVAECACRTLSHLGHAFSSSREPVPSQQWAWFSTPPHGLAEIIGCLKKHQKAIEPAIFSTISSYGIRRLNPLFSDALQAVYPETSDFLQFASSFLQYMVADAPSKEALASQDVIPSLLLFCAQHNDRLAPSPAARYPALKLMVMLWENFPQVIGTQADIVNLILDHLKRGCAIEEPKTSSGAAAIQPTIKLVFHLLHSLLSSASSRPTPRGDAANVPPPLPTPHSSASASVFKLIIFILVQNFAHGPSRSLVFKLLTSELSKSNSSILDLNVIVHPLIKQLNVHGYSNTEFEFFALIAKKKPLCAFIQSHRLLCFVLLPKSVIELLEWLFSVCTNDPTHSRIASIPFAELFSQNSSSKQVESFIDDLCRNALGRIYNASPAPVSTQMVPGRGQQSAAPSSAPDRPLIIETISKIIHVNSKFVNDKLKQYVAHHQHAFHAANGDDVEDQDLSYLAHLLGMSSNVDATVNSDSFEPGSDPDEHHQSHRSSAPSASPLIRPHSEESHARAAPFIPSLALTPADNASSKQPAKQKQQAAAKAPSRLPAPQESVNKSPARDQQQQQQQRGRSRSPDNRRAQQIPGEQQPTAKNRYARSRSPTSEVALERKPEKSPAKARPAAPESKIPVPASKPASAGLEVPPLSYGSDGMQSRGLQINGRERPAARHRSPSNSRIPAPKPKEAASASDMNDIGSLASLAAAPNPKPQARRSRSEIPQSVAKKNAEDAPVVPARRAVSRVPVTRNKDANSTPSSVPRSLPPIKSAAAKNGTPSAASSFPRRPPRAPISAERSEMPPQTSLSEPTLQNFDPLSPMPQVEKFKGRATESQQLRIREAEIEIAKRKRQLRLEKDRQQQMNRKDVILQQMADNNRRKRGVSSDSPAAAAAPSVAGGGAAGIRELRKRRPSLPEPSMSKPHSEDSPPEIIHRPEPRVNQFFDGRRADVAYHSHVSPPPAGFNSRLPAPRAASRPRGSEIPSDAADQQSQPQDALASPLSVMGSPSSSSSPSKGRPSIRVPKAMNMDSPSQPTSPPIAKKLGAIELHRKRIDAQKEEERAKLARLEQEKARLRQQRQNELKKKIEEYQDQKKKELEEIENRSKAERNLAKKLQRENSTLSPAKLSAAIAAAQQQQQQQQQQQSDSQQPLSSPKELFPNNSESPAGLVEAESPLVSENAPVVANDNAAVPEEAAAVPVVQQEAPVIESQPEQQPESAAVEPVLPSASSESPVVAEEAAIPEPIVPAPVENNKSEDSIAAPQEPEVVAEQPQPAEPVQAPVEEAEAEAPAPAPVVPEQPVAPVQEEAPPPPDAPEVVEVVPAPEQASVAEPAVVEAPVDAPPAEAVAPSQPQDAPAEASPVAEASPAAAAEEQLLNDISAVEVPQSKLEMDLEGIKQSADNLLQQENAEAPAAVLQEPASEPAPSS